jgi:anti-sigma B factor antagonist
LSLKIQSRRVGYVTVVDCSGRLVAGENSLALNNEVKRNIDNHINVVINLGAVTFIDSSGLGMLVRLASTTKHTPAGVRFCGANEQMMKVLELTKLTSVLSVHPSEDLAIAAFEGKGQAQHSSAPAEGTILCLDESVDLLAYLRESLERVGFRTQSAKTIPDAILLVRTIRPTVVIAGPLFASRVAAMTTELKIPTIVLGEEFSTQEAGEAITGLLEQVRAKLEKGLA